MSTSRQWRNVVIKISGSASNPHKAYFKCYECNDFVLWLSEDHIIRTEDANRKNYNEEDEVSSKEIMLFNQLSDVKSIIDDIVDWLKLLFVMFFVFVVVVVVFK
ncbi:hypothetical protein RND81_02G065200 [Saponaria officinalis]|uniref:Uncharacterized protein n=1 Tax=Saponaria officinalis TaxID=3572 RepID=A0AAW1MN52_SAPOF